MHTLMELCWLTCCSCQHVLPARCEVSLLSTHTRTIKHASVAGSSAKKAMPQIGSSLKLLSQAIPVPSTRFLHCTGVMALQYSNTARTVKGTGMMLLWH